MRSAGPPGFWLARLQAAGLEPPDERWLAVDRSPAGARPKPPVLGHVKRGLRPVPEGTSESTPAGLASDRRTVTPAQRAPAEWSDKEGRAAGTPYGAGPSDAANGATRSNGSAQSRVTERPTGRWRSVRRRRARLEWFRQANADRALAPHATREPSPRRPGEAPAQASQRARPSPILVGDTGLVHSGPAPSSPPPWKAREEHSGARRRADARPGTPWPGDDGDDAATSASPTQPAMSPRPPVEVSGHARRLSALAWSAAVPDRGRSSGLLARPALPTVSVAQATDPRDRWPSLPGEATRRDSNRRTAELWPALPPDTLDEPPSQGGAPADVERRERLAAERRRL